MTSSSPTWTSRLTGSLASLPEVSTLGEFFRIQSSYPDPETPTNPLTIASKALGKAIETETGSAGYVAFSQELNRLNRTDTTSNETAKFLLNNATVLKAHLTETEGGEVWQTTRDDKGAALWSAMEESVRRIPNPINAVERARGSAHRSTQDTSYDGMLKETQEIIRVIQSLQADRAAREKTAERVREKRRIRAGVKSEIAELSALLPKEAPRKKSAAEATQSSASASSIAVVGAVGLAAAGLTMYLMSSRNGAGSTWDGESMGYAGRGMRAGMSDYRM